MTASLDDLVALQRPSSREPVAVPRLRGPTPLTSAPVGGWRVESRSAGHAVVRFWHHSPRARAVAVAVNGWFRPEPPDACDLEPATHGWWTAAFRVPEDWQASYEVVEHGGDGAPPWHEHGLHRGPRIVPGSTGLREASVPRTVAAGAARPWAAGYGAGSSLDVVTLAPTLPAEPRVRLWRSPAAASDAPLVVFLDGEAHVDRLATPSLIEAAERCGVVPALAVAFVDAGARRADDLGVAGGQAAWIAGSLVPRLQAAGAPGAVSTSRTIVVGSSFAGLSALFALVRAEGTIDAAIAQSASLWRYAEPQLARALSASYPAGRRLRLHAGRYEGEGPARSARLADGLAADGHDATVRIVAGGHDWAWWIPEAIEEIGRLLR